MGTPKHAKSKANDRIQAKRVVQQAEVGETEANFPFTAICRMVQALASVGVGTMDLARLPK